MNIPQELKDRPQWLVWRFIQKDPSKKPSKVPFYATTGKPRSGPQGDDDDRAQLVDYDTAMERAALSGFDGVGFAFLPGDGLIGIDLDGCFNTDDQQREKRARSIIAACASWTEYSPSGNGAHIIVRGETTTFKSNPLGIEVFCGSQFFTMTGNTMPGSPDVIAEISEDTLAKLRKTVRQAEPQAPAKTTAVTTIHQPVANAAKIESALAMLSPDMPYDDWVRIGMAIHAALGPGAMSVWDHWSSRGTKYAGSRDIESHWRSFKPGAVTEASLFKMAMDAGWRPPTQPRQIAAPVAPAPSIDPETGEITPPAHANDNADLLAAVDWFSPFPDVSGKGKPLATIENVAEACRRLGVTVRYNVVRKDIEILIPGAQFTVDNRANASLAWLSSACTRFGIPVGPLGDFVAYLGDQNLYNPVAQWITSRPWDGTSRLQAFYNTIKAEGEEDDVRVWDLKAAMMRRWLISAVAAAFNPNGVSAHGVLVLQGEQYLGKTKWFKQLVPAELGVIQDGLMLRPDDRDSVKQVVSYWLVELGELDATFRKSDIAQLKSFITRDRDVLRRAYAKLESEYARRTVFFASVNPRQFLHDPTGNRRYWTISCVAINHDHGLDMQQVWAEVYEQHYLKGETWYLQPEEMQALNDQNRDHEVLDPIRERLQTRLQWDEPQATWRWMTSTDVMADIGFDRPSRADVTQCGQILLELNGGQRKKSNGRHLTRVPPKVQWMP